MIFTETQLKGCFVIDLNPFEDERGWFARTYCKETFKQIGHQKEWVQMNHSFTKNIGTIRGMHFQSPPFSEIKLVRCVSGAVFDVVVDLRKDSATFLKWVGVVLSAKNKKMIYIPEGFAHGFQVLEQDSELIYHHSAMYQPGVESGIRYNDPLVNIDWPSTATNMSERDSNHNFLNNNFKGI